MDRKEKLLEVQMLGGFQLTYQGQEFQVGKKQTTKALRMLQMLLHAGAAGVSREQLILNLFGYEAESDVINNLSVTVHYLRKLLKESLLPKENYIYIKGGRYGFSSSFPVKVDALDFQEQMERAKKESEESRLELLKNACWLYRGHFLPALSGEEWVTVEGAYYRYLYTECMEELFQLMMARGEQEELFELCGRAAAIYPFDEWQICQMECLMALKRFKEARALYEKTESLYLDELDAAPMERMTEFFHKMSREIQMESGNFNEIQAQLKEEGWEPGAYYCSYPSFVDTYRVMARVMERSGQSVYLMLCTILDERKKHQANSEGLKKVSDKLRECIQQSLRHGDVFTQYNKSQFLVLLMGLRKEESTVIINRIDTCFRRQESSRRVHVTYRTASIAYISEENSTFTLT